jgi:small-conductance mechanosensitive channel
VPHYPHQFLLGAVVLMAALFIRALVRNRVIRSKLRLSLLLVVVYTAINLAFGWLDPGAPGARAIGRLGDAEQLLLALAVINLLVVLLINPWRQDGVPDRFPTIVQDTIVIVVFAAIGTVVLGERIWTVSAVGGVVVGLALQDTLGNMIAGLAIQVEKPFRVGHWIAVGPFEGQVREITWRATRLRTKSGNLIVVPNSTVSKEAITNYSEPAAPIRVEVEVGVTYETPPNAMKAAAVEALASVPSVLASPQPDVILSSFSDFSIVYSVRFWIDDFANDIPIKDQVRTSLYYTLKRRGIGIPFPIRVQYNRRERPPAAPAA